MGNGVKYRAIQRPILTAIFLLRPGLQCGSNQLVQLLTFATVLVQKFRQGFRIIEQAFAPLFRLVMVPFFVSIHPLQRLELCLQSIRWRQTHTLSDELQLSTPCLMLFARHCTIECNRFSQALVLKFNALKMFVWQLCQAFTQRLQCGHFAFDRTFRGSLEQLVGIDIVFFKGASVCHGH